MDADRPGAKAADVDRVGAEAADADRGVARGARREAAVQMFASAPLATLPFRMNGEFPVAI